MTEISDERSPFDNVDDDWLKKVYDNRLQRCLHDNERIWSTAALLLPLSLAPFLVVPSIKQPEIATFIVLGAPSVLLAVVWAIVGESHRLSQDRSTEVMDDIEWHVGFRFRDQPDRPGKTSLEELRSARAARRAFPAVVLILWIVVGCIWPR